MQGRRPSLNLGYVVGNGLHVEAGRLHTWMAFFSLQRLRRNSFPLSSGLPAVLLVGAALLSAGCHPAVTDPNDPKFIVAEKGSWQVLRSQLDSAISTYLKQSQVTAEQVGKANMVKLETAMLQNIVLKKLIMDKAAALQLKDVDKDETAQLEAIKAHLPPGQDFDAQLKAAGLTMDDLKKQIHEKTVIVKVLQAEAFKDSDPTEQEITDFYLKNQDKFNVPAKIRASRVLILVDDKTSPADKAAKKKAIDKAHDRVAKGEDLSKVATEVSEDQYSKPKGGDVGWFQQGENEPQFDAVAFKSPKGVLSPVFETPMGYQFLKVTDSQAPGVVSLAEARPTIANYLKKMKMKQQEEAYSKKLLADSGVTFHIALVDLSAPPAPPAQAPAPAPAPAPAAAAAPANTPATK